MSDSIVNIAGYRFVDLPDRDELRTPMINACKATSLRGTILLAHEGINFFLAGTQQGVDDFLVFLDSDVRFLDIPLKVSHTDYQPFNRMNVRLKKEIISIGMDEVQPAVFTGDSIAPKEFKQWLDDGKTVTILDTRNDYEIRLGTFENAIDLDITSFRAFPAAVDAMPDELKDTPVVMFCTGGIRCEKASVVMLEAGFKDVRQLEGGILGYFEEVGGSHWNGDCFVFDHRVALTPELKESEAVQCYACRQPLTVEEQQSPSYVVEVSCPYCVHLR
jgi:predicted sulfurtransferase